MAHDDQGVLKEVREFLEPGYWLDESSRVGTKRRLRTLSRYDGTGRLYQLTVWELGAEGETEHVVEIGHESSDGGDEQSRTEVRVFTCATWGFEKKEVRFYDSAGQVTSYRESIVDEAGEEVLKDCSVSYGEDGKVEARRCKTSWGGDVIYKYTQDENGFLVRREVWDEQEANRDGAEVYVNDEHGNPVKKTTFAADREGGGVAEVATYENTYW